MKKWLLLLSLLYCPLTFAGQSVTGNLLVSGNVGIGTTAPQSTVQINGADIGDYSQNAYPGNLLIFSNSAMAADNGGVISLGGKYTTAGDLFGWSGIKGGKTNGNNGDADSYLSFFTRNGATSEKMRIDNNGNVGIGNPNPSFMLDVFGDNPGLNMANSAGTYIELDPTSGVYQIGGVDGSGNGTLFQVDDGSQIFNLLGGPAYIQLALGVGTNSHTNELDVSGSSAFGAYAGVNIAPTNSLIISGNVGIGSITPGQKLDVQGAIRSSSINSAATGDILCKKSDNSIGYCSGILTGLVCTCN